MIIVYERELSPVEAASKGPVEDAAHVQHLLDSSGSMNV